MARLTQFSVSLATAVGIVSLITSGIVAPAYADEDAPDGSPGVEVTSTLLPTETPLPDTTDEPTETNTPAPEPSQTADDSQGNGPSTAEPEDTAVPEQPSTGNEESPDEATPHDDDGQPASQKAGGTATATAERAASSLSVSSKSTTARKSVKVTVKTSVAGLAKNAKVGNASVVLSGKKLASIPLINGSKSYTIPASAVTSSKVYTLTVSFKGSSTIAAAKDSAKITVRYHKGSLEVAQSKFAKKLGKAKYSIKSVKSTVRYRYYAKGALVEVTSKGVPKTYRVSGKIYTKYKSMRGPRGTAGVPLERMISGKPAGSLQRFKGGVILAPKSGSGQFTKGKYAKTKMLAVAASQVGFTTQVGVSNKYHKFNKGGTAAWCGMYLSWLGYASGNGNEIPKASNFSEFKRKLVAKGVSGNLKSIKVGDIAVVNAGLGPETHAILVTGVSGDTVYANEGNVYSPRGVRTVRAGGAYAFSSISYYFRPDYS